jgi:hypothetical protein
VIAQESDGLDVHPRGDSLGLVSFVYRNRLVAAQKNGVGLGDLRRILALDGHPHLVRGAQRPQNRLGAVWRCARHALKGGQCGDDEQGGRGHPA